MVLASAITYKTDSALKTQGQYFKKQIFSNSVLYLFSIDFEWTVFYCATKKSSRTRTDERSGNFARTLRILEGTLTDMSDHRIEKITVLPQQTNCFCWQQK
ncbi:hypothetical protein CDAR_565921 [Caerostris darwini]|uniref:Uncharacterized protein n=1 Tax=Caerostris darwini TaxID=1538125 RepID=A0AAV4WAC1_9ARAC|nr:hypothetical protein CDAR_565921 [Caerostris darwini]